MKNASSTIAPKCGLEEKLGVVEEAREIRRVVELVEKGNEPVGTHVRGTEGLVPHVNLRRLPRTKGGGTMKDVGDTHTP